jgi:hypothetical protein
MDVRSQVLDEAGRLISGDRRSTHGDYGQEAERIGRLWGALLSLDGPVPPATVAAMMVALKLARLTTATGRPGLDSWVDAIGYSALGAQISHDLGGDL